MTTTIVQNSFLPTQIPRCVLWLDGADRSPASMTLSGTTVTTWRDKSGNGYNASGVNSPQVVSTGGVSFNAGSAQYFSLSSPFASTHTVYIVSTTSPAPTIYLFGRNFPGGGPTILLNYVGTSLEYYDNESSARRTIAATTTATYIAAYIRTLGTGGSVVARYNGSEAFTQAGPTSEGNSMNWGYLGAASPGFNYYTGTIYEFLIYNAPLTTFQAQQIEGYLAWKWGIQANLPPTHPYKNSPAVFVTQPITLSVLNTTNRVNNAAFLPPTIPGCQLWLDAADRATMTFTSGSTTNVATWNDKSGNGNTATSLGTANPVLTQNLINRRQAISFPNTGTTPSPTYFFDGPISLTGESITYFVVCVPSSVTVMSGSPRILSLAATGAVDYTSALYLVALYQVNTAFGAYRNNSGNVLVAVTSNTPYIFSAIAVNGNVAMYQNGGTVTNIPTGAGASFAVSRFRLANEMNPAINLFNGNIGEVIIYNRTLTTSQRQQVEGYLAWKWGLQVNLPISHPYKNTSAVFVTQPTTLAVLGANPYNSTFEFKYFNPRTISGLTLWLDGADTSSITLSGTNITQWTDKSGQGFNQVGYNNPQYSSLIKGVILNGTTNYFASATSGGSLRIPTATHCLIAVHSPTTISGNGSGNTSLFRFQGVVGTAVTYIVFPYMNGTTPRGYINSQDGTTTAATTGVLVENSVANTQNLIVANIASGSQEVYKNGTLQTSGGAFLSNITSDFFALGCQNWAYINGQQYEFYSGTVYEVMVFNTTITTVQRQTVEGYLAWKWNLQSSLPPTHLFKNYPPPP